MIGQNYVHVVLGFDPELKEAYSIGRRNPAVPLFAGFERENREKILKKYPTARYQVCRVACTKVQREALQQEAKTEWERRFTHHYMVIGLLFLLAGIAFDQKNHDTCSSWLARVTQKVGLQEWQKPFPLVTPRDVYEQLGKDSCVGTLITAPSRFGGYGTFTGTSFAAPFVTGSAALLAQWGVVNGNDPFLYGEKIKAYLQRGAKQLPGYETWPNPQLGYGTLCVKDSIPTSFS